MWYCRLMKTSSFIHYHFRLAVCFLFCAQTARPQAGRAELFGTVRDPAGLAAAGATAELRLPTGPTGHVLLNGKETPSKQRGRWRVLTLSAGRYTGNCN